MNTLKTIYDKIGAKTNLVKHKVELSLVVELMDLEDYASSKVKELEITIDELLPLQIKATKVKKELSGVFSDYKKMLIKVEKSYKELGLEWGGTPYKSDSDKLIKKVNDVIVKSEKK
jgi:hypothetical protein